MNGASAGAPGDWTGNSMADERPRPQYGEYAPVSEAAPAVPVAGQKEADADAAVRPASKSDPQKGAEPPGERPGRRNWDVLLTTVLLALFVYDVVSAYGVLANLFGILRSTYQDQGFGEYVSLELANTVGMIANIVRIALLLITIAISLVLIHRKRLSFVVALCGGLLSVITLVVCVVIAVVNDPALAAYIETQS